MTKMGRAPTLPLYFVNGPIDFLLIGGLSILTFVGLRAFYVGERTELTVALATALLWVVNWPHFSATNYRLYHARANVMQYPMTALVVPWVILAGAAGSVLYPALVAPYFIKIYLIWSPYHFSGQTVGVTLIYARRAGFHVGRWERLALSAFVYGTFISQTLRSEVLVESPSFDFYGIRYPGMGLPVWTVPVATAVMYAGGLVFLAFAARWSWQKGRLLPPIVLVPAAAQFVWFVYSSAYLSFQEFVPFFHGLQYLLIAWSMQLKEKMDLRQIAPSKRYVLTETVRWGALNMLGGAALFFGLPHLAATVVPMPGDYPFLFATGIVVAAVQLHHFFVDGVIWKLRRKTVASPLMVNLSEMVNPPQVEPEPRRMAA